MQKVLAAYVMVTLLVASLFCCGGAELCAASCDQGTTKMCYCSDGTESEQMCKADGSAWEPCDCTDYTIWNDPDTDLSWQDPQKDAYDYSDPGLPQPDALLYCEELVIGGYDDWRLPDIDELRTLVRGNSSTMTGGNCPLQEGSPKADMTDPACGPAPDYQGPGVGGCYWVPELTGTCDKDDPADEGARPLETVSSTMASDDSFWVGDVLFHEGSVPFNHIYSLADVRCVRNGPTSPVTCVEGPPEACTPGETRQCTASNGKTGAQVCADDASCWGPCNSTAFTPSPPQEDISDQCDQVILTITVPEKLQTPPKYLMTFLYVTEGWTFPAGRPPDGGTDYNQVLDPDIDAGNPYVMTIPACSYYRDRCIDPGDYYLSVTLLNSEEWPPTPIEGDYVWGFEQEPMTLNAGPKQVIEREIMLVASVDTDDDELFDYADNCPEDSNTNQSDIDGDCIGDVCDNFPDTYDPTQPDDDSDSIGDVCDKCPYDSENDIDNDGICGDIDTCPADPDNDIDNDDICGDIDTCPADPDNDIDNDGICGDIDTCPADPDNDIDNDDICGDIDNCPDVSNPNQEDEDNNGIGDACDLCPTSTLYGPSSEEAQLLRYFRDEVLSKTPEGRELIGLYYWWSPVIVNAMAADTAFKNEVKDTIDGLLPVIERVIR